MPVQAPSLSVLTEYCYGAAHRALSTEQLELAQRLFGVMAAMAPHDERAWIGLAMIREQASDWRAAAGLYGVGTAFAPPLRLVVSSAKREL